MNRSIKDICRCASGYEDDKFIGLKIDGENAELIFPLGYNLARDEKLMRRDAVLLLNTLKKFSYKDGQKIVTELGQANDKFPLASYERMIMHFLKNGGYSEHETYYTDGKNGKVIWPKTIKHKKPYFQDKNIFFLDFIVKKNRNNENTLLAQIYGYCVYVSLQYLGFIYSSINPDRLKPKIKFNKSLFTNTVRQKLETSFDDKVTELMNDMLCIINNINPYNENSRKLTFGTENFEYVWEMMIDEVFGIQNKNEYFPKTTWIINCFSSEKRNHSLEPDTVMLFDKDIYIIDAKYYKYGCTKRENDLPSTASIQKQITYGEYAEKICTAENSSIYNLFLMPFNSDKELFPAESEIFLVGYAVSDWKDGLKSYERVYGILIDTKYLMQSCINGTNIKGELVSAFKTAVYSPR